MADDVTQLKTLMRELDKVRGVVQVERVLSTGVANGNSPSERPTARR
jgi:hypothetical protein